MAEIEPSLNPYAPTTAVDNDPYVDPAAPAADEEIPASLRRTALRWLVVCGISAAPSFVFGLAITGGQVAGMLTGILLFVIGYTLLDYRTASLPIRRKRTVRRTLKITYGTRIAISILFPIGAYLDTICGILSVGLTQSITGFELRSASGEMGYFAATFTTLVQGALLNVVLGCYALMVHGIQLFVVAVRR